jgi:Mn2+/Fe2+ NRAMP family transporter
MDAVNKSNASFWARMKAHALLRRLGPGLITGVADDDPSGIATYSQAGAQYGLDMLWTMPAAYPLMAAVQSVCARIGRVTGKGLAANIEAAFAPWVLYLVVSGLIVANTLNIGADIAAMGEVGEMMTGLPRHFMSLGFVVITLGLQIFVPYDRYVSYLKWLTLSLLAYGAVLFTVHVPWGEVARQTFWPHFTLNSDSAAMVVGLFGTTISPYLFFWQASEEVEDLYGAPGLRDNPGAARSELDRIAFDTWTGMAYSDLAAYFIILATAVTLHVSGVTQIDTAAQAASALKPLAGPFAYALFSLGIVGVGLLAVPVLAGSGAYAICEAFHWRFGLERKALEARGFYAIITISLLAAIALQYSPVSPMRALFWSAVINGVVAVPLMAVIALLAAKRSVMGDYPARPPILVLCWIGTAIMGAAALWMFAPRV